MKIAIVHDYLIDFGGAERVLLALHEIYPKAPIYTLIYRKKRLEKFADKLDNIKIVQSWFGYLPFADKLISPLRFLIPAIWKSIDLRDFDLIISSASWAVTKGFDKKKGAKEICYCHTPPRYLYHYDTSRRFTGFFGKLVSAYALVVNHFMRQYDYDQAQKVDYFIANSEEVKERIEKFYRRKATVIYPPVELENSRNILPKSDYYLTGGRLTAAKNFDLIIEAFNKLKLPLLVYGRGPMEKRLRALAKENITLLDGITDRQLSDLYATTKGYIVAQKDEDFGMTPIEAMAAGTPVIAYKGGGYLESVVDGKTGVFFDELSVESLVKILKRFEKMKFSAKDCMERAEKFSKDRFRREIGSFIKRHA
jgi:glycosyltransferase involved in cell wall biosynthesis